MQRQRDRRRRPRPPFRRLTAHVAGPDGFSREAALEAVGAGAYAAAIRSRAPASTIAVARDEVSGEAVATTGAVLGAGEELRPTGTDLALLTRVAELTGGKRRDTLAGLFDDRASRSASPTRTRSRPLLVLAAFRPAVLLAVAARRLALPDALAWRSPARLLVPFARARRSRPPSPDRSPPRRPGPSPRRPPRREGPGRALRGDDRAAPKPTRRAESTAASTPS